VPTFIDMYNTSCLNGWAFGNIGSSAEAAATYFYDVLSAPSSTFPPAAGNVAQSGSSSSGGSSSSRSSERIDRILSARSTLEMQQFDAQFTESGSQTSKRF
jgi:hypothetical protein